jgi:Mn-containing catalase
MDIATEVIGHVEMLATMIARLLESSPVEAQEYMAKNSLVGAMLGGARIEDAIVAGMNPQHLIVAGSGPRPSDSIGNPWHAGYTISSGNLLADFRFNVTAESQGRLQVCRLYNMTDDKGVRDKLSFLIARDTMHQNQWLAAIKELEEEGLDRTPVPANFPQELEKQEVAYQFIDASEGPESEQGRWAKGPSVDGNGQFTYTKIQGAHGRRRAARPSRPTHLWHPRVSRASAGGGIVYRWGNFCEDPVGASSVPNRSLLPQRLA